MDAVLLQKVQRADVSYSDLLHQATWAECLTLTAGLW